MGKAGLGWDGCRVDVGWVTHPRFHGRRSVTSLIGVECLSMMLWKPGFLRVIDALRKHQGSQA
jgi:hypothetical protein